MVHFCGQLGKGKMLRTDKQASTIQIVASREAEASIDIHDCPPCSASLGTGGIQELSPEQIAFVHKLHRKFQLLCFNHL